MLLLCVINLLSTVYCSSPALNTSQQMRQQMGALEHFHGFLKGVQREIKESRDLLRHIHFDDSLNYSKPSKVYSKWAVGPGLSRYLLPTVSQELLRTMYTESTAGTLNSPITTTLSFIRRPNPSDQRSFQSVRDYVLPDFAPDYTDIFAPEVQREGVDNATSTEPTVVGETQLPQNALETTGGGNHTHMDDIMKLFGSETTPLVRGDVLGGDVLTGTKELDPHPQLHADLEKFSTGYLSFGFETLCKLIVTQKEEEQVWQVLHPSERVIIRMSEKDHTKFAFMEEPMFSIFYRTATWVSDPKLEMDELMSYAKMMLWLMQGRRQLLSEEVNRIIDFADGMVRQAEGDKIFDVLDDFWHYPNLTRLGKNKTGEQLCEEFINAFSRPYYPYCTDRVRLINSANRALKDRIPKFANFRRKALERFSRVYRRQNGITNGSKYRFKNIRKAIYSITPLILHKNLTQRSTQYDLNRQKYNHNNIQSMRRFSEINDLNKYIHSDYNNPMKYVNTNIPRSTKIKVTSKLKDIIPSTNTNIIKDDITIMKSERIRRGKIEKIYQTDSNTATKRKKSYKNLKHTRRKQLTEFRKENIFKEKDTAKAKHIDYIKTPKELNSDMINETELSKGYFNESDENVLLDVQKLNRILNITSQENVTDGNPLDLSVETDDDEEVLRRLSDVLYAE